MRPNGAPMKTLFLLTSCGGGGSGGEGGGGDEGGGGEARGRGPPTVITLYCNYTVITL